MKVRVAVVAAFLFAASMAAARTRAVSRGLRVPTFSREVVRIFQQNCQECHHAGGIAPFSLTDYQSAGPHALQIKFVTAIGKMPPWKPIDGCGDFVGARRLSADAIDTIRRWVDAGAPEGNRNDLPLPLEFSSEWKLGVPDLVVAPTEPYTPPPGTDTFRCFVLPIQFSSDTYVTAFDVHPTARELVHHIEVFLDSTGKAKQLDDADPAPGFDLFAGGLEIPFGLLGAWMPGADAFMLPDRVAFKIPKGAAIVLQVHYHPAEATIPDRPEVALYLAHSPIEKVARTASFYVDHIDLPAGALGVVVQTSKPIGEAVEVYGVRAHMHFLGRSISGTAVRPDGERDCLLTVNDWDIHWQDLYRYRTPLQLPAGTMINVTGQYDNPGPRAVHDGYHATDEMCGVELIYAPADEHLFIVP